MENKKFFVLKPFFNSSRYWHFNELLKETKVSKPQLTSWLKYFEKKNLIKRIKEKGKMPYYVRNFQNPSFRSLKRLYAHKILTETGFIEHILSLKDTNSVILFGSFSRSDWHKGSDIDLFVYGKAKNLQVGNFEKILNREIQLFICEDKKCLKQMTSPLLRNIIQGDVIKGTIPPEVIKSAAV